MSFFSIMSFSLYHLFMFVFSFPFWYYILSRIHWFANSSYKCCSSSVLNLPHVYLLYYTIFFISTIHIFLGLYTLTLFFGILPLWYAAVFSLRFIIQVGNVSDRQTTFITRYVINTQIRSCRLTPSIPHPTGRNCQWQTDHVHYTLCIKLFAYFRLDSSELKLPRLLHVVKGICKCVVDVSSFQFH